eukprot:261317-Chlamydomonas_euryale.AAC.1
MGGLSTVATSHGAARVITFTHTCMCLCVVRTTRYKELWKEFVEAMTPTLTTNNDWLEALGA